MKSRKHILDLKNVPRGESFYYAVICSALAHKSEQKKMKNNAEHYKHLVQKLKAKTNKSTYNLNKVKMFEIANQININIFQLTQKFFKCVFQSTQRNIFEWV